MKPWGMLFGIDLILCNPIKLRSHRCLRVFVDGLCKEIDMVPYGNTIIRRFGGGKLEGNSAFQFIQTSSIVIHCDEENNRVFVDIFSCKKFDALRAEKYTIAFFEAASHSAFVRLRG